MDCPGCKVTIEPTGAPIGAAAKAVLLDWRTWAFAFACFAAAGVIGHLLNLGPHAGTGAGAGVGLFVALRSTSLRRCPACSAVFRP